MCDWLTIQFEKDHDSQARKFIQANPVLDSTMKTLLASYLNLSEAKVQKWVQEYEENASE